MKTVCPVCRTRKPQRLCRRADMSEVCSPCCAEKRHKPEVSQLDQTRAKGVCVCAMWERTETDQYLPTIQQGRGIDHDDAKERSDSR